MCPKMSATSVIFKIPAQSKQSLISPNLGPMLRFLKYFRRKKLQKIGVFDSKQI
jgi:hypothetical protein